ncbi:MAG: SMC-Scp complex subunit ScpB [Pseudomonadota bacterium]
MNDEYNLVQILEAALFAAGKPLTLASMAALFDEHERPDTASIREALAQIDSACEGRGYELVEVASGFRFQVREQLSPWVGRLWQERPQRYSRALLETLALIAYRQPITRGEIEEIRGVAVSTNIIRTLHEREWIRVVGHRDVPGRPAMYATTRQFLDYFSLKSLDQLPALADIRDLETLNAELGFADAVSSDQPDNASLADNVTALHEARSDQNKEVTGESPATQVKAAEPEREPSPTVEAQAGAADAGDISEPPEPKGQVQEPTSGPDLIDGSSAPVSEANAAAGTDDQRG